MLFLYSSSFFFFNDTATTEIYTLSLHDALPICWMIARVTFSRVLRRCSMDSMSHWAAWILRLRYSLALGSAPRSEEHTSELQSRLHLVCRLLLEKKKKLQNKISTA